MTAAQAKKLSKEWAQAQGESLRGLVGAYLSGSILEAAEDAPWPEVSDVDVVLVFSPGCRPEKLGKLMYRGLLLEGTCLEEGEFSSLEGVLSTHYLAYALNRGQILWDPHGRLEELHRQVASQYAQPQWVQARIGSQLERVRQGLSAPLPEGWPQQVNAVLFPVGVTCFPVLLADLRNCTVRRRYAAARVVLERRGLLKEYPRCWGCWPPRPLGKERLLAHWEALSQTFSLASESRGPSQGYPFRSDISPQGKKAALEGCRELLSSPWPEEAAFWMGATFARCQIILEMDDPQTARRRLAAFQAFFEDLGLGTQEGLRRRREEVLNALPWLEALAREVSRRRILSEDFYTKTVDKTGPECYSEDVF